MRSTKCPVPRHSVIELERKSFFHVGVILALSLLHGGPSPQFFFFCCGRLCFEGVKCILEDVPDFHIRRLLDGHVLPEKRLLWSCGVVRPTDVLDFCTS